MKTDGTRDIHEFFERERGSSINIKRLIGKVWAAQNRWMKSVHLFSSQCIYLVASKSRAHIRLAFYMETNRSRKESRPKAVFIDTNGLFRHLPIYEISRDRKSYSTKEGRGGSIIEKSCELSEFRKFSFLELEQQKSVLPWQCCSQKWYLLYDANFNHALLTICRSFSPSV